MFLVQKRWTRPDVNVLWPWDSIIDPEISEYMRTTYEDTGKLIFKDISIHETQLEAIYTQLWLNEESFNEFAIDSRMNQFRNLREQYLSANNIIGHPYESNQL